MLLFFRTKMQPTHFWKKHWTQNKPWIVIGCLLRLYLKWSFLHFHHIKKKNTYWNWKLFRITGFLNEHQTLTVMWEFVMWSGSSTVVNFLVYASPGLLAHHLQQNFKICLSSNTTKSLPSSDSSTKYTTNKSLVSLISVYFKLGIPRISVHLITVGLVAPVGIPRILGMDA